jgi:hypothetical protein
LAYSISDLLDPSDDPASVIVIVLIDSEGGALEGRVRSDWKTIVTEEHHEYISSVLHDIKTRSESDPSLLFHQVSNLNVGPIVTIAVGSNLESDPALWNLYKRFVRL